MSPIRTVPRKKEGTQFSGAMAKHKSMITPLESQEQKAIVKWLSYHPVVRDYFLKLNNEGKRTEATGWHLKQLGLRAGASDLFIYYPTKTYHGLWLEVKRNKKYTPSERSTPTWISQEKFIESVKKVGFAGEFCYGLECGIKIIESYLLT